jgi:hypothetical protein
MVLDKHVDVGLDEKAGLHRRCLLDFDCYRHWVWCHTVSDKHVDVDQAEIVKVDSKVVDAMVQRQEVDLKVAAMLQRQGVYSKVVAAMLQHQEAVADSESRPLIINS